MRDKHIANLSKRYSWFHMLPSWVFCLFLVKAPNSSFLLLPFLSISMDVPVASPGPNGNDYNEKQEWAFVSNSNLDFELKVCCSKSFLTLSDSTARLFQISCQQLVEITKHQVFNGSDTNAMFEVFFSFFHKVGTG